MILNTHTHTYIYTYIYILSNVTENIIPVIAPNGAPIYRIERGGEVTFHGPGQLVGYPLINLKGEPYKQDLHWYLRMVEEVVIGTLSHYDIVGVRDEINTGKCSTIYNSNPSVWFEN